MGTGAGTAHDWRMAMIESPLHAAATEPRDGHGLGYLPKMARERKNVFAALMEAVKTHSPGQISHALYDVGGEYRRNM